jgi:hypothetical protein
MYSIVKLENDAIRKNINMFTKYRCTGLLRPKSAKHELRRLREPDPFF